MVTPYLTGELLAEDVDRDVGDWPADKKMDNDKHRTQYYLHLLAARVPPRVFESLTSDDPMSRQVP